MEYLLASGVGLMTAAGVFLILRRHTFPVILGLALYFAPPAGILLTIVAILGWFASRHPATPKDREPGP